jgi:hypothetical protein
MAETPPGIVAARIVRDRSSTCAARARVDAREGAADRVLACG